MQKQVQALLVCLFGVVNVHTIGSLEEPNQEIVYHAYQSLSDADIYYEGLANSGFNHVDSNEPKESKEPFLADDDTDQLLKTKKTSRVKTQRAFWAQFFCCWRVD